MGSVTISSYKEFDDLYKQYRNTLIDVYYTHAKHTNLNRVNNNLKSVVAASIENNTGIEDIDSYEYYDVHEFLVLVLYSAYNKILGIDSGRLVKLSFGFTGCAEILQSLLGILGKSDAEFLSETMNILLSVGRDEDYNGYIENKHYCDDLINIKELLDLSKKRVGADSDELNVLIGETFNKNIESSLNMIKSRFSYMLEGTFGIDKYKGIYTGKTPAVMQGVKKGTVGVVKPDSDFATKFKPIFDEILNIDLCSEIDASNTNGRQFDTALIAKNFGLNVDYMAVKPIYFPFKMLEFISKCGLVKQDGSYTFTKQTQLLNYTRLPEGIVGTKDKYLNAISKYFESEIIDYIYRCLIIYCKANFSDKYLVLTGDSSINSIADSEERKKKQKKLKSDIELAIIDILENREECIVESTQGEQVGYSSLVAYILNSLRYFVDCVTTAVILDKCETAQEDGYGGSKIDSILEFRIKICSRLNPQYREYTNKQFIDSLVSISGLNSSDMSSIEETSAIVDEQGFSMIDVKYTFNMEKVNARPTFAYKALEALIGQQSAEDREAGKASVSWQNILLGRNLSDRILTSGVDGDICLQNNQVHWIFSGSRSGKGVMCYNIFATAIGARIPIFYIDRKPDTATVLSALCPDMFCVNGGQYDSTIDTSGVFEPSTYSFNIPTYLSKDLAENQNKFDFVYFRSIMLVLAMFDYADTFKDSELGKKLLNAFGGGVLLVLDEFSNFVKDFLADTKPMSASSGSWLSKAKSQTGMLKDLQQVSTGVKKARLNLVKAEGKKNVTEEELAIARDNLNVAESAEFELDKVYWAAIADAYQAIKDSLGGKKDAAGAVAKSMQIFVIGQDLNKVESALGESDWFNTGAAGNTLKFNKSNGIIPLIHLLGGLSTDVLTGYQKDRQSYLAQGNNKFRTKNLLNASRRCFAYKKFGSFSKSELGKLTHTEDALKGNEQSIKGYLDSWTYFKPFLILNNAEEPPECVRDKSFAPDKETRENVRKGIAKLDSMSEAEQLACANSQYVGQCLCSCESAGLSWDDLISDNDDGSGHLNSGIGFEGYISQLAGGIPVDSMALSGQLATEFIQKVYGYPGDWRQFVCDFRPEWIVSTKGYTQDGSQNIVQDRLADSFFYKGLLSLNPAEVLGNKLESLLQYYGAVQSDNLDELDNETFGVDDTEDFEKSISEEISAESVQEPVLEPVQTANWYDAELGINSEDDYTEPIQSEDVNNIGWSESDRYAVAEGMVSAFLMALQMGNPDMYKKVGNQNLRPCLIDKMIELLIQKGY